MVKDLNGESAVIEVAESVQLDRMKKIVFKNQDTEKTISAQDVFSSLYDGLNDLRIINLVNKYPKGAANLGMIDWDWVGDTMDEKAADIYMKWLHSQTKIVASITYQDNAVEDFEVRRREDFDPDGILKLPSVVFLKNRNNDTLVLRESRMYDVDELLRPAGNLFFRKCFDLHATRQFYSDQTEIKASKNPKGVMYLPEPQLLCALEKLYQENDVLRRFTPEFRIVGAKEDRFWQLRNYTQSWQESGNRDCSDLGNYIGLIHSLGLMELADRQLIHFCYLEEGLGMYDPDFFTHTCSENNLIGHDYNNLKKLLFEADPRFMSSRSYGSKSKTQRKRKNQYEHTLKNARDNTLGKLTSQGITPHLLLETIKPNIDTSLLKKLEVQD